MLSKVSQKKNREQIIQSGFVNRLSWFMDRFDSTELWGHKSAIANYNKPSIIIIPCRVTPLTWSIYFGCQQKNGFTLNLWLKCLYSRLKVMPPFILF